MKNKTFWFLFTLFIVTWSLYELYPPTSRNLIDVFEEQAHNTNTNLPPAVALEQLKKMGTEARRLEQDKPGRTYSNLREAIGTNVITNYFAYVNVATQRDPTQAILNQLQRE